MKVLNKAELWQVSGGIDVSQQDVDTTGIRFLGMLLGGVVMFTYTASVAATLAFPYNLILPAAAVISGLEPGADLINSLYNFQILSSKAIENIPVTRRV